jgi:GNAT superfamily N-acetyltransferase
MAPSGAFFFIRMQLLTATEKHLPLIAPLFDAYRVFYQQPSDPKGSMEFLKARMAQDESVLFLAIVDGHGAGFIQLYYTFSSVSMEKSLILNDLYVAKPDRKKGVGEALLRHAQAYCRDKHYKGLALETGVDNPAQKLYERLGWVRDSHCFHYFWKAGN